VLGSLVAGCGVNTIPTLDEQVKSQWSEVQNQYQRRAELIPNLVETVKGFAAQERETLTAVVEARAKATSINVSADQLSDPAAVEKFRQAQEQLSGALGRLLAVTENYPELKSNQNFLALQSQLEGTENRIAVARRDYIGSVQTYNTEVRTFPGRLWAWIYGAQPKATFATSEQNQSAPTVKF
jgi:LemA protein